MLNDRDGNDYVRLQERFLRFRLQSASDALDDFELSKTELWLLTCVAVTRLVDPFNERLMGKCRGILWGSRQ